MSTNEPVISHYKWLDLYLKNFFHQCGLPETAHIGTAVAHGDKCYSYKEEWLSCGIPFPHGVAVYLLTYEQPYQSEVRITDKGWVAPSWWVIRNYLRFQSILPAVDVTDQRIWLFNSDYLREVM